KLARTKWRTSSDKARRDDEIRMPKTNVAFARGAKRPRATNSRHVISHSSFSRHSSFVLRHFAPRPFPGVRWFPGITPGFPVQPVRALRIILLHGWQERYQ